MQRLPFAPPSPRRRHGTLRWKCWASWSHNRRADLRARQDAPRLSSSSVLGGEMVITPLFYDTDLFLKFVKDARKIGIAVPIIIPRHSLG